MGHQQTIARLIAEAAADLSHDEVRDSLHAAICSQLNVDPNTWDGPHPWIRDVFDTEVIWEWDSKTWRAPYTMAGTDASLGDTVEVRVTYAPVGEAAAIDLDAREIREAIVGKLMADATFRQDFARTLEKIPAPMSDMVIITEAASLISESAVADDGTATVKVIQPGWGSSGFYGPEMLARDAKTAWPKGTHMFWDHPTLTEEHDRPERSLHDLAGELAEDAYYATDATEGPGVYAKVKVFDNYAPTVEQLAGSMGVSIRSPGLLVAGEAEGRKGYIVEELGGGGSVDFVTAAGAGGRVMELFESAGRSPRPINPKEGDVETLQEAQDRAKAAEDRIAEAERKEREASEATERANTALRVAAGDRVAREALADSKLPDAVKDKIAKAVANEAPAKDDGTLDAEKLKETIGARVKEETDYLTSVLGRTVVEGLGDPAPSASGKRGAMSEDDQKEIDERLSGISEALGHNEDTTKEFVRGRR